MMALLDFTTAPHGGSQRHLPEWQAQPPITPLIIIDHSIVGSGEIAWHQFNERSVLESHFIVCGAGDTLDGWIWQLMDTDRQADANFHANDQGGVSVETGDQGDPDHQLWTPNQVRSLVWLHAELRRVHPTIPNRRSRSCADPAGHGYHTMHGAPSCWTPVAKTCPGLARRAQWDTELLPAYLTGQPPQEDDMPTAQEIQDAVTAALVDQRDDLAAEIAKRIGSPHVFVSANDARGVFVVTDLGLLHVDGPAAYAALSGGRPLRKAPSGPTQLVTAEWLTSKLAGEG